MEIDWNPERGGRPAASNGGRSTTAQLERPQAGEPIKPTGEATAERLVLSVAETAEALGISDDLVYELMHRGELPCLHFGRRKVIPRRAIELVIRAAMSDFDPAALLVTLSTRAANRA